MESGEHPMWKNMDWEKEKAKDGKRDRQRASGKKKKETNLEEREEWVEVLPVLNEKRIRVVS